MDEEELDRLAAEELLKEAKQGAARAVIHGALGWKKDMVPKTNKRFLTTTLAHTMQHNHRRSRSRSRSRSRYGSGSRSKLSESHYHKRYNSLAKPHHRSSRHHSPSRSPPKISFHSRKDSQGAREKDDRNHNNDNKRHKSGEKSKIKKGSHKHKKRH